LIGTIGGLKDAVHEAIVRRIATISLALAADPAAARPRPTTFDKTSTSLDEAASRLPQVMVSLGNPSPLAAFPTHTPAMPAVGQLIRIEVIGSMFTVSGISTMQWEVANPSDKFDWQGYLEKLYIRP
jgi:hypothetical protein